MEEEGVRRTLENFERTGIGGREGWMSRWGKDKNHRGRKEVLGEGRGVDPV